MLRHAHNNNIIMKQIILELGGDRVTKSLFCLMEILYPPQDTGCLAMEYTRTHLHLFRGRLTFHFISQSHHIPVVVWVKQVN